MLPLVYKSVLRCSYMCWIIAIFSALFNKSSKTFIYQGCFFNDLFLCSDNKLLFFFSNKGNQLLNICQRFSDSDNRSYYFKLKPLTRGENKRDHLLVGSMANRPLFLSPIVFWNRWLMLHFSSFSWLDCLGTNAFRSLLNSSICHCVKHWCFEIQHLSWLIVDHRHFVST